MRVNVYRSNWTAFCYIKAFISSQAVFIFCLKPNVVRWKLMEDEGNRSHVCAFMMNAHCDPIPLDIRVGFYISAEMQWLSSGELLQMSECPFVIVTLFWVHFHVFAPCRQHERNLLAKHPGRPLWGEYKRGHAEVWVLLYAGGGLGKPMWTLRNW